MDKNVAWVSLVPAFGINFTIGVLQFASALIRQTLLQNAGNSGDVHYITWITSIYAGSYNLLGPLSSVLIYKMGCRKTVLIGGTLETLGLIGCYFVKNIRFFLLTYSLLSGIGAGISYPPAVILLGYNFNRYLPIASGIAVSGIGIGFIVMPVLTQFLLDRYGLQGTFLIMAGLTLQKWVFGALMQPSPFELDKLKKSQKSTIVSQGKKSNNMTVSKKMSKFHLSNQVDNQQGFPFDLPTEDGVENDNKIDVLALCQIHAENQSTKKTVDICITTDDLTRNHNKMAAICELKEKIFKRRTDQKKTITNCKTVDRTSKIKTIDTFGQETLPRNYNFNQKKNLAKISKCLNIKLNPYIDVVKNSNFLLLLFCISCFSVSESLIYLVIPTYFVSKGSTVSEISHLFTILGTFSTLTRPLMGFLANSKVVDINILVSVPFGILGIMTFILPQMAHVYTGRICFVITFALYNCSIYSLLNPKLVLICGIDNLSASFGLLMFVKGIATIFGPPITVFMAHSSDSVFLVAGFMYEMASLTALFLGGKSSTTEIEPENLPHEQI